jgi:hypothetical protein
VGASPLCETCHRSTRNWLDLDLSASNSVGSNSVVRSGRGVTTARAGVLAATVPPPPRHILLGGGATCTSCHRSARDMTTAVVMNHRVVGPLDCKACQSGTCVAQGAQGTPGQHSPYQAMLLNGSGMDCDDCHKGFSGAHWASVKMNHNGSLGAGAGLCKGCHLQGSAASGPMEKNALNHARAASPPADCSGTGCHAPLGRIGARFGNWR